MISTLVEHRGMWADVVVGFETIGVLTGWHLRVPRNECWECEARGFTHENYPRAHFIGQRFKIVFYPGLTAEPDSVLIGQATILFDQASQEFVFRGIGDLRRQERSVYESL